MSYKAAYSGRRTVSSTAVFLQKEVTSDEEHGLKTACRDLAEKSLRIFEPEWKENRHVHENYNAITGELSGKTR